MNIQDLKSNTTWQEASNTINNNNNKISLAIATLENAKLKNKGYFTTVEKLNEAIPNPTIGSKAYVGTSEPYAIYIVENGVWVDSGYTGGDEIAAKITTDRIENGAVTSEKIATSAFDSTLSVSGKIAPADVVGEKLTELDKELGNLDNLNTNTKDSVVLAINEINEKVNSDVALSPELKSILLQCFSKVAWSVEDGQSYLTSLRAALYPSKLLGIRAEYNGGLVKVGTSIYDLDISVYAIFNDVTEEIRDYTLSGEITSAENIITISYMGKTTNIVVNAVGIESITAIYNGGVVAIGTSLADLDISVYAVYSNEETEAVTDYTLSGEITSETNIITITYSGFTTTIEVNAVERILKLPDMTYTSNGGTQISITNGNHFKLIAGSDITAQAGSLLSLSKLSSNNPIITNNASHVNNQPSLFTISANETITLKLLNIIEDVTYTYRYGGLALGLRAAKSSTSVFTAIGVGKSDDGATRPVQTQKTFSVPTDIGSVAVYLQLMASGSIIEFDLSMVNSNGKIYI